MYGVADGQQLTMDYYAPKGAGPHPIAIIIHGGGYQRGNSKSGSINSRLRVRSDIAAKNVPFITNAHVPNTAIGMSCHAGPSARRL